MRELRVEVLISSSLGVALAGAGYQAGYSLPTTVSLGAVVPLVMLVLLRLSGRSKWKGE